MKQSLKNSLKVAVNGVNTKKKDKFSQTEKKNHRLIHNVNSSIALPSSDPSADEIDKNFGDDF